MKTDPGEFWSRNVTVAKRSSKPCQYMHNIHLIFSLMEQKKEKNSSSTKIILPLVSYNTSAPRITFWCILKIVASHMPHVSPITYKTSQNHLVVYQCHLHMIDWYAFVLKEMKKHVDAGSNHEKVFRTNCNQQL